MTEQEKTHIRELQKQGVSYGNIAAQTGISRNTIKSFLRRNVGELTPSTTEPIKTVCQNCGCEISMTPHKKAKKFCSDSCRMQWWNAHRDLVKVNVVYRLECQCCHKRFSDPGHKNRKFCSVACYRQARFGGGDE